MDTKREPGILQWNKYEDIYTGPGLVDLQVNGINGIDFNDTALVKEDVLRATEYLLSRGVTVFFPTVITNSDERILALLHTLYEAYTFYPLVRQSVGGFHLEGPFISPEEGARGAHDPQFIKPPDPELFKRFQDEAGGNIKLITLAPEWEHSCDFIKKCKEGGVLVSMGHSVADNDQIKRAADAGMSLSTHLGNGIPLMLKRHPNLLWDQLAEDRLFSMIIADGHHIPDSFIRVVMKAKEKHVALVSDTTKFAGMNAGEYETFIGGSVVLDDEKRLFLKSNRDILAGAAKDLLECVKTMIDHDLASVEEAWAMASGRVSNMLESGGVCLNSAQKGSVEFKYDKNEIRIRKVIKNDKIVYEGKTLTI